MLKFVKHVINQVRAVFRDTMTGGKRSPQWPKVEKAFRAAHPTCAACGTTEKIQVHHKHPFHLFPALELDPNNLISLCMGPNECHLLVGHGDNFKAWNPNVEADSAETLSHPEERATVIEHAKQARVLGEDA
jgi:5-methylcytosine-specific restriction protein A